MYALRLLALVPLFAVATRHVDAAEMDHTSGRPVALREVVSLALKHSPSLGAAVADLDYAKGALLATRGLDDLTLDASGTWQEQRRPTVPGTPVQTTASDDLLGWLQLTQPLPTGGRIGLRLQNEWTREQFQQQDPKTKQFSPSASTVWSPSLQVVFSHSLLRGFGLKVARAQRYRAVALRDWATMQRASTVAVLIRDVVSAYYELAYAREEIEVRHELAKAARDQLEVVSENIKVGKQPSSAKAEVLVSIALRDEDALLAEQAGRERSLELERLIGAPVDEHARRLTAAERVLPTLEALPSVAEVLDDARRHNYQLLAAKAQARAAQVDVDVTQNGILPQLDISFAGGPEGYVSTAGGALSQLGHFQAFGLTTSVTFSEAIPQRAGRGARDAARALLHKAKLSVDEIELQIETTVVSLLSQRDVAGRRMEVLAPATDQAALDLEAERARFAVGRASNFDVLRRQEELATAKLRQARARTDYLRTLAALGAITDEILDRYQVVLK